MNIGSIQLAQYIGYLCKKYDYPFNNTKIQKLMYICYGTFLAEKSIHIIEEKPQILYYGPIFKSALQYIQNLSDINDLSKDISGILDKDTKDTLQDIIKKIGIYSARKLVDWSHQEHQPWHMAQKLGGLQIGDIIPDSFTKSAFIIEPYNEIKL